MNRKITLEEIQKLYPEVISINGPYLRKCDNRLILIVYTTKSDKKTTLSYPKILYEVHYNKRIKPNESIEHIDKNPLNNDINNLRCLDLRCLDLRCLDLRCLDLRCLDLRCLDLRCLDLRCLDLRCLDLRCLDLRCLDLSFHVAMDDNRRKPFLVKYKYCGKEILITNGRKKNCKHTGYFCSRECSGKYGRKIQLGLMKKEYVEQIKHEYFSFHELYDYNDDSSFGQEFTLEDSNNEFLEGFTEFK